jgi:SAM-dependent methyltransferase
MEREGESGEEAICRKESGGYTPEGSSPGSYPIFYQLLQSTGKSPLRVLDFGCGNGVLVKFLRERGIETLGVDPVSAECDVKRYIYRALSDLPEQKFDAIAAIEVFEHLKRPVDTLSELMPFLDEGGFIFITTALTNRSLPNPRVFPYWVYQKDPAHVGFFHEKTLEWIAERFGFDIHILDFNYIVLDRGSGRLIMRVEPDNRLVFLREDHSVVVRP